MRGVRLISLSVVLALVGWGLACAKDFYVIPVPKGNYAPVEKTGQTTSYASNDDGDLEKGVAWPTPRFTDNGDGTVTDNLTQLIWLKNACCSGGNWTQALGFAATLASGSCGLTDGSQAGDWRLPNVKELLSLIDYGHAYPALPAGHPFTTVDPGPYWSSTTRTASTTSAWTVVFIEGDAGSSAKSSYCWVWPVRGGQ